MRKVIVILLIIWSLQLFGKEEILAIKPAKRIPLKAGILSAVVPGGGQFYNRSYIKGGVILAVEGLLIGYAVRNHNEADKYYKEWQETESAIAFANYEIFYEKRDNDIWWLGLTMFLSAMDAVTDAYLHDFDYQKAKVNLKFKEKAVFLEYKF